MNITVNDVPVEIHDGARVKDAVFKYYTQQGEELPKSMPVIEDKYGNQVDGEGRLTEGSSLFITKKKRKRSWFRGMFVLVFAAGLISGCSTGRKAVTSAPAERQAVIFAVNDIHAAIDNFPKLAYIVDSLRLLYPDMLLVAAGDNQTGNPVNDQYPEKGLPVVELMNATGFNLSAVGNHEFDSNPEGFSSLTHKADFDFICANVSVTGSYDIRISPYKIITLSNGLRLAFLGLLQLNQNGIPDSHPDNVKGFAFRSPFDVAGEYAWLDDSVDINIALTHIGFESDVKLAETMPPGIDLIIGGHSHTRVEKEQIHNGIMITQAENKLKYGTLIRLNVKSDGSLQRNMELVNIRDSRSEKPSVRAMVDRFNDNRALNELAAVATDDFSSYEQLGYLMADAQRDAALADIALVNPGGVRIGNLPKGPVTIMNIYQLDPFGNELIVTKLTGKEIHSLMKAAFTLDDKSPLYTSGIRTRHKLDASGDLLEVSLMNEEGSPLDMDRTYSVAMNSYMTSVYKYEHNDPGQSLFITTADALISYLKKNPELRSYSGENRIEIIR